MPLVRLRERFYFWEIEEVSRHAKALVSFLDVFKNIFDERPAIQPDEKTVLVQSLQPFGS